MWGGGKTQLIIELHSLLQGIRLVYKVYKILLRYCIKLHTYKAVMKQQINQLLKVLCNYYIIYNKKKR